VCIIMYVQVCVRESECVYVCVFDGMCSGVSG